MYEITLDNIRTAIREEMQKVLKISVNRDQLIPRKDAAKILGIKEQTLSVWATKGVGPAPTKIGAKSMYRIAVLEQFIKDQTMPR